MSARSLAYRRRGRAALVWTVGMFLLFQAIGSGLLDYVWPSVRFPTRKIVLDALRSQAASPDVLFLGSSRFGAGLPPAEIASLLDRSLTPKRPIAVFNCAIEAGDLITAEHMFEQALGTGARPSLVVVEVSPETLNASNAWIHFHMRRQLCWHDIPAYLPEAWRTREIGMLWNSRFLALYTHLRQICRQIGQWIADVRAGRWRSSPTGPVWSAMGATPIRGSSASEPINWDWLLRKSDDAPDGTLLERSRMGATCMKRELRNYRVGGTSAAALDRMLGRCNALGMRVVLVAVPVSQAHREWYTPEVDAAFVAHLRGLEATHGCWFVDYRDLVPDRNFRDHHHLTGEGGLYFSRTLTREVLVPAWRGQFGTMARSARR